MKTFRLSFATAVMILFSSPAWAVLVGSSVTGTLQFGGSGPNYFDPANGFVPGPSLNTAGITVTISASATEFGFLDGSNNDLANFTTTQLIITDVVFSGAGSWQMTFTSSAFTGITLGSSNFSGLTSSFASNVITLNWGGTSTPGTYIAVFDVSTTGAVATPDGGSTALLLGLAFVAIALFTRYLQPKLRRLVVRR